MSLSVKGASWALPEPSEGELLRREERRPFQRQLDAQHGIPIKQPQPRTMLDAMADDIMQGRPGARPR